jgi:omega-6 fatty acid desaturase (delta-12 desaturase)
MDTNRAKAAADAMARRTVQRDSWSVLALAADEAMYVAGVFLAVNSEVLWLKIVGVIVAGTATSTLFILGHDAAHRSLFKSRRVNAIVGRLVFFPCLHNHTLWLYQHNHLHHQHTNVRGLNSYSPMSHEEFRGASRWTRAAERIYRSPIGFGAYYLIERWFKHKFFATQKTPASMRRMAMFDLILLLTWTGALCCTLYWVGVQNGYRQPGMAILWGFVFPFLVWNQLMGLTAFVQHTNPRANWIGSGDAHRGRAEQIHVTVDVQFPIWYDILSHNIMIHPAHHVNPRIPWYRLRAAQRELEEIVGDDIVADKMSPKFLWRLWRECQLYDYDAHRWLTFDGQPMHELDRQAIFAERPNPKVT